MADPVSILSMGAQGFGLKKGADALGDFLNPELPEPEPLPPPVEEVDVSGQKKYTKQRLKSRKGRKSTILSTMGSNNQGKKTVLG